MSDNIPRDIASASSDESLLEGVRAIYGERLVGATRLVGRHSVPVIAFGTFSLAGLKVLGVALWDPNTAMALLAAGDPGRVLLGLFVSLIPLVTALALYGAGVLVGITASGKTSKAGPLVLYVWLALMASLTTPLGVFLYGLIGGLASGVMIWLTDRSLERGPLGPLSAAFLEENSRLLREMTSFTRYLTLLMPLLIVFLTLYGSDPWMPAEQISFQDRVVVGYVVADDGGWTSILSPSTRLIEIVRSVAIIGRAVCAPTTSVLGKPLYQALGQTPSSPNCSAP